MPGIEDEMGGLLAGAQGTSVGAGFDFMGTVGAIDLTKSSDGRIIPAGTYVEATVAKIVAGRSKSSNSPMLTVGLVVYWPKEYAGSRIRDYWTLTEDSIWKMKSAGRSTDLLSEDGATFLCNTEQDFLGKPLGFTATVEEYKGVSSNKVLGSFQKPEHDHERSESSPDSDAPVFE